MKKKLKLIIWPIVYLVLIINVCISFILVFRSYYFRSIFVSGSSMEPTLHGTTSDRVDYGIIDDHDSAINRIKRFQIITTYYPFQGSSDYVDVDGDGQGYEHGENNIIDEKEASYKIKRVYALPGDTFEFAIDEEFEAIALNLVNKGSDRFSPEVQYAASRAIQFKVNGKLANINFKRRIDPAKIKDYKNFNENHAPYKLADDEYWVMGDNYAASSDCFTKAEPIYRDNIVGVLIAIEGTCKINIDIDSSSDVDGTKISYQCKDRKRHFPTYY